MSGNNMLCPNCGTHHHTVEHDSCVGPMYTIEPHGDGYAIYQGRTSNLHGFNLGDVTGDLARIANIVNTKNG